MRAKPKKRTPRSSAPDLTPKQQAFVDAVLSGKSPKEAYLIAYPASKNWKPHSVETRFRMQMKHPKIRYHIERHRAKVEDKLAERGAEFVWNQLTAAKALLTIFQQNKEFIQSTKGGATGNMLRAIQELNKIYGLHAPEKLEHSYNIPDDVRQKIEGIFSKAPPPKKPQGER